MAQTETEIVINSDPATQQIDKIFIKPIRQLLITKSIIPYVN